LQACSAVDRAFEFWIFFVASRHFCLAAATPLPEPAVVDAAVDEVDDDEEVFEPPHALSAVTARTSRTRSASDGTSLALLLAFGLGLYLGDDDPERLGDLYGGVCRARRR
jgi:hypothetical protein